MESENVFSGDPFSKFDQTYFISCVSDLKPGEKV